MTYSWRISVSRSHVLRRLDDYSTTTVKTREIDKKEKSNLKNLLEYTNLNSKRIIWEEQLDIKFISFSWLLLIITVLLQVALTVLPLNVAYAVLGRWIFGSITCKVWLTADVLCCTASILNLCAIALDRWEEMVYICWWSLSLIVMLECTFYTAVHLLSYTISFIFTFLHNISTPSLQTKNQRGFSISIYITWLQ